MECTLHDSLEIYDRVMILGDVEYFHVNETVMTHGRSMPGRWTQWVVSGDRFTRSPIRWSSSAGTELGDTREGFTYLNVFNGPQCR